MTRRTGRWRRRDQSFGLQVRAIGWVGVTARFSDRRYNAHAGWHSPPG